MQMSALEAAEMLFDRADEFRKVWRENGSWRCPRCLKPEARPQEHAPLGVFECSGCGWPRRDSRSLEVRKEHALDQGICGICEKLANDPGR